MKLAFAVFTLALLPGSASAFSDVSQAHVHTDAIAYVESQGIVQGYADGSFRADAGINRAEFTKIVMEAVKDVSQGSNCFPDVQNEWFASYICEAKNAGIIGGYPDGTFQPGSSISFVEGAKIIVNAFGKNTPEGDGQWYAPYVLSLEEVRAIPQQIQSLSQPLTRGQMAEIIYRLHAERTDLSSKTYMMLGGSITTNITSSSSSASSTTSITQNSHELPYTLEINPSWQTEWDVHEIEGTSESMKNVEIMEGEGKFSEFMRIHFPAKSGNRFLWKFYQKPLGGFLTWVNPHIVPQNEIYLQYYMRFPKGFDFSKSGSLPGIFTGMSNDRTEESAAAVQLGWDKEGSLTVGGAFVDTFEHAGHLSTSATLNDDGEWHRLDIHVRLQTHPSKGNGLLEVFMDGEQVLLNENILFSNRSGDAWDALILAASIGDVNAATTASSDTYIDFAGFILSKKRAQ